MLKTFLVFLHGIQATLIYSWLEEKLKNRISDKWIAMNNKMYCGDSEACIRALILNLLKLFFSVDEK